VLWNKLQRKERQQNISLCEQSLYLNVSIFNLPDSRQHLWTQSQLYLAASENTKDVPFNSKDVTNIHSGAKKARTLSFLAFGLVGAQTKVAEISENYGTAKSTLWYPSGRLIALVTGFYRNVKIIRPFLADRFAVFKRNSVFMGFPKFIWSLWIIFLRTDVLQR